MGLGSGGRAMSSLFHVLDGLLMGATCRVCRSHRSHRWCPAGASCSLLSPGHQPCLSRGWQGRPLRLQHGGSFAGGTVIPPATTSATGSGQGRPSAGVTAAARAQPPCHQPSLVPLHWWWHELARPPCQPPVLGRRLPPPGSCLRPGPPPHRGGKTGALGVFKGLHCVFQWLVVFVLGL